MPLLGAHMSIAGGLHKAVEAAAASGMATVQIFTHSPSQWAVKPVDPAGKGLLRAGKSLTRSTKQWQAKPLTPEAVQLFRRTLRETKLRYPTAHDSYLINLASPNANLYRQSIEAFLSEVERADLLGLKYLVMHPGTPTDGNEEEGLQRIVRALDEVDRRCPQAKVQVLLETTAGQGLSLGHRFEHLAQILALVQEPRRLGVCLDTCHVFAAGYALAPELDYQATFHEFERVIGLKWLKCFHLNDSKKPLGSRVDRHEHIGRGYLGLEPFRLLVNDPRFRTKPMILETPKEEGDNDDMDSVNLATVRGLVAHEGCP